MPLGKQPRFPNKKLQKGSDAKKDDSASNPKKRTACISINNPPPRNARQNDPPLAQDDIASPINTDESPPAPKKSNTGNDGNEGETAFPLRANPFLALSPALFLKTTKELGGVLKLTGELPAQLKLVDAGYGLVTFLLIDEYGTDNAAYSVPLQMACDSKEGSPNHKVYSKLIDDIGLLAYLPRRVSKESNKCLYTRANDRGIKYKQLLYVLHLEDKSNGKKKEILEIVQKFLRAENILVEIKEKFDETNFMKQSLDNFIEDKYVLRLHNLAFKKATDETFFEKSNTTLRAAFFSHPYPPEAALLGYPVVLPEDLSDDIDAEIAATPVKSQAHSTPSSAGTCLSKPIYLD